MGDGLADFVLAWSKHTAFVSIQAKVGAEAKQMDDVQYGRDKMPAPLVKMPCRMPCEHLSFAMRIASCAMDELECTSFVKSEARLSSARPKAAHKSVLTHCFCLPP